MSVVKAFLVPGIPHPLLCPDKNEGWQRLRDGFEQLGQDLQDSGAELILLYSTMWPSVIGHQIQAREEPEWVHVDELFHDLGSIPYRFKMDSNYAHAYQKAASERGLHARCVDYHGFPIDTGSVTALKLLTPNNEIPACIVSSNVYADRAETMVLGKAALDAALATGKNIAVGAVMTLSNRLFTEFIDPSDDRIHSGKDEEWNQKLLQFNSEARIDHLAQLSREIHKQIRVKKVVNFKPFWWLSATSGATLLKVHLCQEPEARFAPSPILNQWETRSSTKRCGGVCRRSMSSTTARPHPPPSADSSATGRPSPTKTSFVPTRPTPCRCLSPRAACGRPALSQRSRATTTRDKCHSRWPDLRQRRESTGLRCRPADTSGGGEHQADSRGSGFQPGEGR